MADDWGSIGTLVGPTAPPGGADDWDSIGRVVPPPRKRTNRERLSQNIDDGLKRSGLGASSRAVDADMDGADLGDVVGRVYVKPGGRADRILQSFGVAPSTAEMSPAAKAERERQAKAAQTGAEDPWHQAPGGEIGKAVAAASTLGGQVIGAALSPENWVAPGRTVAGRMAGNAGVAGGADVLLQGGEKGSGVRDEYDPWQTAGAVVAGAAISGGIDATKGALRPVARAAGDGVRAAGRAVANADWDDIGAVVGRAAAADPFAPAAIKAPSLREPAVRGDLWSRLITQESGGNQAAVSPKGAFGRAQLMPKTALEVATRLGDPSLAERARTDSAVNERLGKAYLDEQLRRFAGDEAKALAAYNAGARRVQNAVRKAHAEGGSWLDYMPAETRAYVPAILGGGSGAKPDRIDTLEAGLGPRAERQEPVRRTGMGDGRDTALTPVRQPPEAAAPDTAPLSPRKATSPISDAAAGPQPETPARRVMADLAAGKSHAELIADRIGFEAELTASGWRRDGKDGWRGPDGESLFFRSQGDLGAPIAQYRPAQGFTSDRPQPEPVTRNGGLLLDEWEGVGRTVKPANALQSRRGPGAPTGLQARPTSAAAAVGAGDPNYRGQRISELANRIRQAVGVPVRPGRISGGHRVRGTFNRQSGVARVRSIQGEIGTVTHELTHGLEFTLKPPALLAALRKHANEVKKLAYPGAPKDKLRVEGFAEFGRLYVTRPDDALREAPAFHAAFEAALGKDNPQLLADLRAIRNDYQATLKGAALDVASAAVSYTGKRHPISEVARELWGGTGATLERMADEVYRGIWDKQHPINVWLRKVQRLAVANTGTKLDLEVADNPYARARMATDAYGVAQVDLMHGVVPYKGVDPEGPSVRDVMSLAYGDKSPTPEIESRFGAYLIARRMVNEWDRFGRGELERAPDKVEHNRAFHEQVIADAEALHPAWAEAAEKAHEFNRLHWKLEFEAGFITRKAYEAGIKNHVFYVPLMRDMSEQPGPAGGPGRPRGTAQFAGGVKAFKGSDRDIIHPLTSMTRRAFELRTAILKNEVFASMHRAAEHAGPGVGGLLEVLPAAELKPLEVNVIEALQKAGEAAGVSERDLTTLTNAAQAMLEGEVLATLFRKQEISPRKGEAVVFLWRNGEKVPLLLPDGKFGQQLFTVLSGMTHDNRGTWEEVMAAGATALRTGVTGVPEFAVKTTLRDQIAAAILTDVGYVPGLDFARGLKSEIGKDQAAIRYKATGGLMGGHNVAAARRPIPKTDAQARQQLALLRRGGLPVKDWHGAMRLTDIGDTATRIGVFRKALAKAKARGLSDAKAVMEAGYASRDFFDPTRTGGWPIVMQTARIVPFFNSSLQGPDKAARVLRQAFLKPETMTDRRAFNHAYKALGLLAASAVLGVTLAAINSKDPDWKNINDQVRATHLPLFKDKSGDWVLFPKAFELGMPSNLSERLYEAVVLKDPLWLKRVGHDLLNTVAPTRDTPVLATIYQHAKNRTYQGSPIIPDHLNGKVEPRLQVNAYTSKTARLLAGNLVSPAVVEHYITGLLGSAGRDILKAGDMAINAAQGHPRMSMGPEDAYLSRGYVRRTARGSDSERHFWRLMGNDGAYEKRANSFGLLVREGKDADAAAYLRKLTPSERAYVVADTLMKGNDRRSHPLIRAKAAMGVISDVRREAREGTLVGPNRQLIRMSPRERKAVDDALDDLALIEASNGQKAAGVEGWAQRPYQSPREVADKIKDISPPVMQALKARFREEKVLPVSAAAERWRKLEARVQSLGDEKLARLMVEERTQTKVGKAEERRRRVVAANEQPRNALAPYSLASPNALATTVRKTPDDPATRNVFAPQSPRNAFARQ